MWLQGRNQRGKGDGGLSYPFLKIKKSALILENNARIMFINVWNLSFKMLFSQYIGKKTLNVFPVGSFFHVLRGKMFIEVPLFQEPPLP